MAQDKKNSIQSSSSAKSSEIKWDQVSPSWVPHRHLMSARKQFQQWKVTEDDTALIWKDLQTVGAQKAFANVALSMAFADMIWLAI